MYYRIMWFLAITILVLAGTLNAYLAYTAKNAIQVERDADNLEHDYKIVTTKIELYQLKGKIIDSKFRKEVDTYNTKLVRFRKDNPSYTIKAKTVDLSEYEKQEEPNNDGQESSVAEPTEQ